MNTHIGSAAQLLRFGALSGAVTAIAILAMNGGASAATYTGACDGASCTVTDSGSIPFAPDNVGTAATAGYQNSTTITNPAFDSNISSITFSGGTSPGSGVYGGSASGVALSPFALGLASQPATLAEYFVAQGGGGTVTINFKTAQTKLDIVWGSVDFPLNYNIVTAGGQTITGANIASLDSTITSGNNNVAVQIAGLTSFTSVTFSDNNSPAFEFDIGEATATPLPAALPLFAAGLGAMGLLGWRRKRKNSAAIAAA